MRRPAALPAMAVAGLAVLLAVAPVAAKEGMAAELTTPIDRGAEPGSTIEVGWTAFQADPTDGDRLPFAGVPTFVRLVAADGTSTHQVGDEVATGSGTYRASITVPAGGIERVEIGLVGEVCEAGTCTRNDVLFILTGDVFVGVPGAAPADPAAAPDSGAVARPGQVADPVAVTASPSMAWLLALGAVGAVLAGGATAVIARRRARAAAIRA